MLIDGSPGPIFTDRDPAMLPDFLPFGHNFPHILRVFTIPAGIQIGGEKVGGIIQFLPKGSDHDGRIGSIPGRIFGFGQGVQFPNNTGRVTQLNTEFIAQPPSENRRMVVALADHFDQLGRSIGPIFLIESHSTDE